MAHLRIMYKDILLHSCVLYITSSLQLVKVEQTLITLDYTAGKLLDFRRRGLKKSHLISVLTNHRLFIQYILYY